MAQTPSGYELLGCNASPYSRKMLAILRYRRLPHRWRVQDPATLSEAEAGKLRLMPMLRGPGQAQFECDSTPLAHRLEAEHPQRGIIPEDPALAFLCHLIEDYADEWCTKLMFYFRWHDPDAARFAARWVIADIRPELRGAAREAVEAAFYQRQRSRRELVGCAPVNGPLLERHFRELLAALEQLGGADPYLFGSRPSLADFALHGQLSQLALDPWPQSLLRQQAPRVENWLCRLDDASGVEGDWDASALDSATLAALLGMIARSYLPFLQQNARALAAGDSLVSLEIEGEPYAQPPFKYQAKCLQDLQSHWQRLDADSRVRLQPLLRASACAAFFA